MEYLPQKSHVSEQYLAPDLPWGDLLQNVRMLDCGAYDGDTYENFRDKGIDIEYWNFVEPDPANFAKIKIKFAPALQNASYTQAGVSNSNEYLGFETNSKSNGSKFSKNSNNFVKTIRLDEMPDSSVFNFIKFDIEGEELNALEGAALTIEKNKPLMAISIYHLPSHHWEILNYLSTLQTTYSYFLRVHGEQTFDTVLYALPN
jgi:FkbM family methyltransferase